MNVRDDIKQLQTTDRELRKFGMMVGGVLALLGLFFLWRHKSLWPWLLWPGTGLIVAGVILPRALKWVYVAWMSIAIVLGFIMAHVILTLFFFLIIMPTGLLARLFGQDFLRLKIDRSAKSHWIPRAKKMKSAAEYERQY